MADKKLLKHLVFLMFFIFLADFLAKSFYWYSLLWYFDMVMHFLGGLWVGLFFIYVFSTRKQGSLSPSSFIQTLLLVLVVGILWEFFEFYLGIVSRAVFDWSDTVSDIILDLAGAAASVFYFVKILGLKNK